MIGEIESDRYQVFFWQSDSYQVGQCIGPGIQRKKQKQKGHWKGVSWYLLRLNPKNINNLL